MKKLEVLLALLGFLSMDWGVAGIAVAQTPGVTATEIKLGQTKPYSGPASAYGLQGKAETAYFQMINDNGGINGRKVNLISLDDAYSPPKPLNRRAASSSKMRSRQSSEHWVHLRTQLSKNT